MPVHAPGTEDGSVWKESPRVAEMTGTLFIIATPIGNLEDITVRALRVLREVAVIAAEDTRRTGKLLAHYGIATPTISFHQHNHRSRGPQLISRLRKGESVGLVTDAGTPGVADPGVELVQACIHEGIAVDPIPGASALLAAAVASGFPLVPLTFVGFAPSRSKDRIQWLRRLSEVAGTIAFFEAPHRISASLHDMSSVLGERPIVIGRELTKQHQEFLRGFAATLAQRLESAKGELTVVVGPAVDRAPTPETIPDDEVTRMFCEMTESGRFERRGEAVAALAKRLSRSRKEIYDALERTKSVK